MRAVATMTGAAFDALPYENEVRQELFDGECVDMPSTTFEHQSIVTNLLLSLNAYLRKSGGGICPDVDFALGENTRVRPDLAIILGEDFRNLDRKKVPIPRPPAIAIEVISPSERTAYSTKKIRLYLNRGVQEAWQVFPEDRIILVYSQGLTLATYTEQDHLTSLLLPGWTLPVAEAFAV